LPPIWTRTLLELSITWLFVRISPDGETTIPVPAAWPRPPASVVLMTATAGSTADSMAPMFTPPVLGAPAPVAAKPTTPAPTTDAPTTARLRIQREGAAREPGDRAPGMAGIVAGEALNRLWSCCGEDEAP
jgi:hypothetical protein